MTAVQEQVKVKERPIIFSGEMVEALMRDVNPKTMTRRALRPQPVWNEGVVWRDVCTIPGFWTWQRSQTHNILLHKGAPYQSDILEHCPYGKPGDRLYAKEAFAYVMATAYRCSEGAQRIVNPNDPHEAAVYRAGWDMSKPGRWRSPRFMPRWASRLLLEVVSVRVERVQDITEEDARAEGVPPNWIGDLSTGHGYGKRGWDPDKDGYLPAGWEKMGADDESFGLWTAREAFATWWDHINGAGAWERNEWVWCVSFRNLEG